MYSNQFNPYMPYPQPQPQPQPVVNTWTPPPNQSYTLQPQNQQRQINYLNGRFVDRPEDIYPQEVVMDGTVSFFPSKDLKRIYAKAWNNQGTIDTLVYELQNPVSVDGPKKQPIDDFMDEIRQRLSSIESAIANAPRRNNKPKNEEVQQ